MKQPSQSEKHIWFAVFILEGVVIIICNIISLVVFSRKARQSKSRLLLMNQSLADLLVGMDAIYYSLRFVSSDFGHRALPSQNSGCLPNVFIVTMTTWNFVSHLSQASLALIALDRACAIFKPFRHRVLKAKHYYHGIFGVWLLSAIPASFVVILRCETFDIVGTVSFTFAVIVVLGTLLVLVTAYTSVYIKIKYFPVFQNDTNSHARSQIKLSLTLCIASVASMLTVLPSTLIMIILFTGQSNNFNLREFAAFLTFCNSFVNFFIYAWRFPEFAQNMTNFFCCEKRPVNGVSSIEMTSNVQTNNRNTRMGRCNETMSFSNTSIRQH